MDDSQCQLLFGVDKKTITADLQRETETALVKADFVTTNELTVLQAYVLSLVSDAKMIIVSQSLYRHLLV